MKVTSKLLIRQFLQPRPLQSHKGTYGKGLIVGGQPGMSGSVILASLGALRSGIGLSHVLTDKSVAQVVNNHSLETITHSIDQWQATEDLFQQVLKLANQMDALAIGPGWGQNPSLHSLLEHLLMNYQSPIVIDADGLNLVAKNLDVLKHHDQLVLTPHEMEMARLTQKPLKEVQTNRQLLAESLARQYGAVVVLKGHATIITDGATTYRNTTGNPGMATAGSGDVLTGIIMAQLAQGHSPLTAALIGVYLHGLSGDLASKAVGQTSLIASDLVNYLPAAYLEVQQTRRHSGVKLV